MNPLLQTLEPRTTLEEAHNDHGKNRDSSEQRGGSTQRGSDFGHVITFSFSVTGSPGRVFAYWRKLFLLPFLSYPNGQTFHSSPH